MPAVSDRFVHLLAPHRGDLERYCRAAVRDAAEAVDVLQDAVLRCYRDFARFQDGTSFRAFVFRYVVHESLNQNRRARARARREQPLEHEPPGPELELAAEVLHDRLLAAPLEVLDQCQDEIRRAFLCLQPRERIAFLLVSLGGFRVREVAELLSAPVGTVLSLVFRARRQLRTHLAAVAHERGLLPREAGA